MSESAENKSSLIEKLPHWFVPGAGVIYATGFLIVFSFMERFSVRETGDFFKVKYIHSGLMYWLFPAIVVVPLYCFYLLSQLRKERREFNIERLREEQKKSLDAMDPLDEAGRKIMTQAYEARIVQDDAIPEQLRIYRPSLLLVINMLLVFYLFALFAPVGFASQREYLVFVIFAATLVGVILIRVGIPERFGNHARWLLCIVIIVGLDFYSFKGMFHHLWEILWGGGKYFLLFLFLIALTLERTRVRVKVVTDQRQKTVIKVIAFCIVFSLYYLSVLAFALRLYPYIPVLKGGGDYVNTPTVVLCFQGANTTLNLPEIAGRQEPTDCLPSRQLQIIEETSSSIFVADPADAGGPSEWRIGKKPKVFEIRRDRIASITYVNHP